MPAATDVLSATVVAALLILPPPSKADATASVDITPQLQQAGLDIDAIIRDVYAPTPRYRYALVLQRAVDFCNELKALGASLLSAHEKTDAETLARMRSTHTLKVQVRLA